jgi:hypothetical protein
MGKETLLGIFSRKWLSTLEVPKNISAILFAANKVV